MNIDFLIDENGHIIKDSLPIDSSGKIISNTTLTPINYEWDDIKNMENPTYNFITKLFEDNLIDKDYWITQMNAESDPILKEGLRIKALLIIRLISFFILWKLSEDYNNKWRILENISDNVCIDDKIILFVTSNDKLKRKSSNYIDNEKEITTYGVYTIQYIGNKQILFLNIATDLLYKKSIDDIDNETQLTTYPIFNDYKYIGNNTIIFVKPGIGMFKKSINDIDNETQLTTYQVRLNDYLGNNEILFQKLSDNFLYKKSINDIDNETQLTTYIANEGKYVNKNEIIFFKNLDLHLYKKSINDIDNETQLTTFDVYFGSIIPNDQILFQKASNNFLYKKSINDIDNETQLTTFDVYFPHYIGNNEVALFFIDNQLYKKSINDIDNETQLTTYNINSNFQTLYIPQFYYNNDLFAEYNTKKLELEKLIKELNNIMFGTTTQLNNYYTNIQTLREKYNIYAYENIDNIKDIYENDRLWLNKMALILGVG